MKQVLSQQEIDSLLNALNTGEIDPNEIKEEEEKNKIRSYDFRRPNRLSKEYISTLNMIFENFSKIASNFLSTQIHTNVNIKMGAVEQISYDEFIHSIPNPTLMGIYHTEPLNGTQIIEINPQFGTQVIELMCGGSKTEYNKKNDKKAKFTDIELGILQEMVFNLLKSFKSAWNEVIELTPILDSMETNPQLVQTMSPNEPVILISFSVEVFGENSFMNICIPYVSFEEISDKLSIKSWFDLEKGQDAASYDNVIGKKLMVSDVDLKVILGSTIITVDDFLQLEVGDVIALDLKTNQPLKMYVEDKLYYLVKPGEYNGKLAVQVIQYVEEDVDY